MYPINRGSLPDSSEDSGSASTSRGAVTGGQATESQLGGSDTLPDGSSQQGRMPMQAASSVLSIDPAAQEREEEGASRLVMQLLNQPETRADSMDVDAGEEGSSDFPSASSSEPVGIVLSASEFTLLAGEQIVTYYLGSHMSAVGKQAVLDSFRQGTQQDIPMLASPFVDRWALRSKNSATGRNHPLTLVEGPDGKTVGIFLDPQTVLTAPSRVVTSKESGPLKRKVPYIGDGPPLAKRPKYF